MSPQIIVLEDVQQKCVKIASQVYQNRVKSVSRVYQKFVESVSKVFQKCVGLMFGRRKTIDLVDSFRLTPLSSGSDVTRSSYEGLSFGFAFLF